MKELENYEAPVVEVIEVEVEKGLQQVTKDLVSGNNKY